MSEVGYMVVEIDYIGVRSGTHGIRGRLLVSEVGYMVVKR